jgi:hypothetical protein
MFINFSRLLFDRRRRSPYTGVILLNTSLSARYTAKFPDDKMVSYRKVEPDRVQPTTKTGAFALSIFAIVRSQNDFIPSLRRRYEGAFGDEVKNTSSLVKSITSKKCETRRVQKRNLSRCLMSVRQKQAGQERGAADTPLATTCQQLIHVL